MAHVPSPLPVGFTFTSPPQPIPTRELKFPSTRAVTAGVPPRPLPSSSQVNVSGAKSNNTTMGVNVPGFVGDIQDDASNGFSWTKALTVGALSVGAAVGLGMYLLKGQDKKQRKKRAQKRKQKLKKQQNKNQAAVAEDQQQAQQQQQQADNQQPPAASRQISTESQPAISRATTSELLSPVSVDNKTSQNNSKQAAVDDLMSASVTANAEADAVKSAKERSVALAKEAGLLHSQKDYDKAIQLFTEAINLDPENNRFYTNRAVSLSAVKRYAEAIEDTNQSLAKEKTAKALFLRGRAAMSIQKYQLAAQDFESILQMEQDDGMKKNAQASLEKVKEKLAEIRQQEEQERMRQEFQQALFAHQMRQLNEEYEAKERAKANTDNNNNNNDEDDEHVDEHVDASASPMTASNDSLTRSMLFDANNAPMYASQPFSDLGASTSPVHVEHENESGISSLSLSQTQIKPQDDQQVVQEQEETKQDDANAQHVDQEQVQQQQSTIVVAEEEEQQQQQQQQQHDEQTQEQLSPTAQSLRSSGMFPEDSMMSSSLPVFGSAIHVNDIHDSAVINQHEQNEVAPAIASDTTATATEESVPVDESGFEQRQQDDVVEEQAKEQKEQQEQNEQHQQEQQQPDNTAKASLMDSLD